MVDFIDMQKNPELYGIDPKSIEDLDNQIDIITFKDDKKSGLMARYKGKRVQLEWEFQNTVQKNETWLCVLNSRDTGIKAEPIQKIDAAFFFQLKSQQVEVIANILWETHKDSLMPTLEERFLENRESTESETIKKYIQEIEKLKSQIDQLEDSAAADKKIIESLESDNVKGIKTSNSLNKPIESPPNFPNFDDFTSSLDYCMVQNAIVKRIRPDIIFSDSFVRTRYFVHISKDRRLLLVRPHEYGDAICLNGRIELTGLGSLVQYDSPKELVARYNPTYGGLLINL